MNYQLVHNADKYQYEFHIDGFVAVIIYEVLNANIHLLHTIVPPQLAGKGVGSELVKQTFQQIEAKKQKLVAVCPFVVAYLKRHPEWERLLANKN